MSEELYKSARIDDLPDRTAHLRRIAERIALDQAPPASDHAPKEVEPPSRGYRVPGLGFHGCRRGPHS